MGSLELENLAWFDNFTSPKYAGCNGVLKAKIVNTRLSDIIIQSFQNSVKLKNFMKISIIIPTYNRPEFLAQAMESILDQTLLPDEIIIGDDSTDDITEKLVKENFIARSSVSIHYFHHKPSLRQARNVDFLIQKVSNDSLLLLHDDDLLMPECLEILKASLIKNPEVVASFGLQYVIDDFGQLIPGGETTINENSYRIAKNSGKVDGEWASIIGMFPNNAFLIKSEIAKKIGYNYAEKAGDAVDFYFGYLVGKGNQFFFVNDYTSKYRHSIQSISNSSKNLFSSKLDILLKDLSRDKFANYEIKKTIKWLMNPAITELIERGEKKNALKWMLSTHYNVFTLKGIKRVLMLMTPM